MGLFIINSLSDGVIYQYSQVSVRTGMYMYVRTLLSLSFIIIMKYLMGMWSVREEYFTIACTIHNTVERSFIVSFLFVFSLPWYVYCVRATAVRNS
jgi:hypothetical protein